MKKLLGTILIVWPFIVLLLIFIEGGILGLFLYVLYLSIAFCSTLSVSVGLWCFKYPGVTLHYNGKQIK